MNAEERTAAPPLADSRASDTRRGILDAAEQLFAEHGFAATAMRAIARAANTSQALLHHHFGTKAKLYESVKHRFTERFNTTARLPSSDSPGPQYIVSIVRGYFDFLIENPSLSRLASWARLEGDEAPWGASDVIWHHALAWVGKAKTAGLLRPEVDDRLLLVVGGALVQYWVDNRKVLCRTLGIDPNEPGLDERYIRQALTILLHGVGSPVLDSVDIGAGARIQRAPATGSNG